MHHIHRGAIAPGSTHTCLATESEENLRLDQFLANRFPGYSRSYFQQLIEQGHVTIEGKVSVKPRTLVKEAARVHFNVPANSARTSPYSVSELAHLNVKIIFEHEHFLIVEKPAGLIVHAASSAPASLAEITLVDWLVAHFADIKKVDASDRPGIVHRLDKDTSGLLVIARNAYSLGQFGDMFKNRTIKKTYIAIVEGTPAASGTIDFAIARHPTERTKMTHLIAYGRESRTDYTVEAFFPSTSVLRVNPATGRTHQIRVHCAAIGHPIIGDKVYGKASPLIARQALHAHKLQFTFEGTDFEFEAPIPEDMQKLLDLLKNQ